MKKRREVTRKICDVVAAECSAAFGDRILSLVVTGSVARDEATVVSLDSGWKLLGDAEFLVVVRQTSGPADATSLDFIKSESEAKLRSERIEVDIDLGLVRTSYLKNLPPHIFSYELRACGKVISGDPGILNLIPTYGPKDLSREDAWRLLCNRMIEQFRFMGEPMNSATQLSPRLHYATVKLFLDMATSYLVFAGDYAPTYRERAERLMALAQQAGNASTFPLRKFAIRVTECTSWKLTGDGADYDNRVEFWHEAINYMRRLWRWEMLQLTGERSEFAIHCLMARLASQQGIKQRLRGWMSLAKRRGWKASWLDWPRWVKLAVRSTPRYLVYQVAAEVAFRLPCLVKQSDQHSRLNVNWRKLHALLPQSNLDGDTDWRKVANDVLWNYSDFLQNTRA